MKVAVVGLGAMGSRIVARLRATGHDVVDRAELATADVTIVMVSDAGALRAVTPELRSARAVIVMATVGVEAVRELRAELSAPVLDAPVLGSLAEVEAGTLTIFADADAFADVLGALGRVVRVADGQAAKLVANFALLASVVSVGEAAALGERLGLQREATFDVLAATPLAQQAARRRGAIDDGTYPPRFRLALAAKDARLVAEAAPDHPVAAALLQWFERAEADGLGDRDYTAVLARILGLS
jgi:3-hydroxyisobutyrate dehydrogenase-like beta-hydroxyacid dehydrogenase